MAWMMVLGLLLGVILFGWGLILDDTCISLEELVTSSNLSRIDKLSSKGHLIQHCLDVSSSPSLTSSLGLTSHFDQISGIATQMSSF